MHCSSRFLCQNLVMPTKPLLAPSCASPPKSNPIFRRHLLSSSSLLLLFDLGSAHPLRAETVTNCNCADPAPTKRAFLDISIDGEPIGRILIGLYDDAVPAGAARFGDLVSGATGVSYRRKEFVKITPKYVQHRGLRSYGADAELARKRGSNLGLAVDRLVEEWKNRNEICQGTKNVAKSVSLIVRDPSKQPPKLKLVARQGKLQIDQEEAEMDPNGTEFVIATKDSPELDPSALVVGEVLQGMDVVERIGQVKTVQENSTSPYFRYPPFSTEIKHASRVTGIFGKHVVSGSLFVNK